jgi:hypothetical protein
LMLPKLGLAELLRFWAGGWLTTLGLGRMFPKLGFGGLLVVVVSV